VTALSDSVSMVLDIMVNKKELRPKAPFDDFIDVRDCARIHVWAATSSEASGKRFLASAGPFAEEQIQAIIAQRFPTSPAAIQVAAQVKSQASTYVTCADTKQLAAVYKEPFIALEQSIIDTATAIGKAFNQEQLVAMAETQ
jgi:nucleoside-diphosphate-sugar epimerase